MEKSSFKRTPSARSDCTKERGTDDQDAPKNSAIMAKEQLAGVGDRGQVSQPKKEQPEKDRKQRLKSANKETAQASYWLEKANEGLPAAQYGLSVCLQKGWGAERNQAEAARWCQLAAGQGHYLAMFNLGTFHHHGHGVKKDLALAVDWYRKAAEAGEVRAANNLGVCFEKGHGLEKDFTQAVYWYRQASDQNNAPAQCNLGVCYEEGRGIEQSGEQAVLYYTRAAEQNHAEAQLRLARCRRRGVGTQKDLVEAYMWCKKSADQKNEEAVIELEEILRELEDLTRELEEQREKLVLEHNTLIDEEGGNENEISTQFIDENSQMKPGAINPSPRSCCNPKCTHFASSPLHQIGSKSFKKPTTSGESMLPIANERSRGRLNIPMQTRRLSAIILKSHYCSDKCRVTHENTLIMC
mmetsp:Transcript_1520/g.2175  ORF Transcript_1520/g.2175 Transcript_1520/m.2175 type:complete len:412 (-) Transcript_1520:117-1352(-)